MTKTELESKHLAELHSLAAEAGIPRYRMLRREELIEKLAGGAPPSEKREERPRRERKPRKPRESREPRPPAKAAAEPSPPPAPAAPAAAPERPKRKRRRRFRRKRKGVRVHDLLLPPAGSRQAIVYGESRASCTALLREIAAEISGSGPDPIGLLIDPSPEELADWRREAPKAEIVAAGQARHADDAFAQAAARANGGEDVIVLVDSLSRYAEAFADADAAKELFDAGLAPGRTGTGSLTVVAAVERPA